MRRKGLIFVLLFEVANGSILEFLGLKATQPPPPLNTALTIEQLPDHQKLDPPTSNKPQLIQLNGPIKAGQLLHIVGEFDKDSVNRLQLDFLVNATYVPLSVSTKPHNFSANPNVLASIFEVDFPNGTILNDTVPSPLMDSKAFDFRVRFLDQHIQIFANLGEIGIYERIGFLESAKTIRLTGSIKSLSMFRLKGAKYPNPFTRQITFGNSSRLDITAHPIPNILDQAKMRSYFPNQGWENVIESTKQRNEQRKIDQLFTYASNTSARLYLQYGVYSWAEFDSKAANLSVHELHEMLQRRTKRRSSRTSSKGYSASRISSSSSRTSWSSSSRSRGSSSSSWGWGSSYGSHHYGHGYSSGSGRSWFSSGGGSSYSHHEEPPWYGRTDRDAYLFTDRQGQAKNNHSARQRLGKWQPYPGAATAGYMYHARTPSYSYRYGGQTHFQSTCGDCTYYCDGCCKGCDEPRIFFHNRRPNWADDPDKMPLSERFDVTFFDAKDSPRFQISIRFIEGVIVRNTFNKGKWEKEERDGALPIDGWKIFQMTIVNSDEALTIYFGGKKFTDFRHREATRSLEKMKIDGDLEIHKVVLDGKLIEAV